MAESITTRFIAALGNLEKSRDLEPLASLFSEDTEVGNVIVPEKFHGAKGAREFWKKYRDTFETIESSFANTIEADGRAALEWRTKASGHDGEQISYEGVSILEVENDKIKRFRAYFDAGALARQMQSPETKVVER